MLLLLLTAWAVDLDLDQHEGPDDCDDNDPTVHVDAVELCDRKDNNCDDQADEASLELTDALDPACVWHHADLDADGWGAPWRNSYCLCPTFEALELDNGVVVEVEPPQECLHWSGDALIPGHRLGGVCFVTSDNDCDNLVYAIHPTPPGGLSGEVTADGVDQDCDALDLCYVDADLDGHAGDTTAPGPLGCISAGFGATVTDCDDGAAAISPDGAEVCGDGVDDDCDGADVACPPDLPPEDTDLPPVDAAPEDGGAQGGCAGWGGAYAALLALPVRRRRR